MANLDPFEVLLCQTHSQDVEVGIFRPLVGYLYENGSVVRFSSDMSWYSFDRCMSACFHSAAKRIKGTWEARVKKRGRVRAFLMMVVDNRGNIVWKHKVNVPPQLSHKANG